MRTLHEIAPFLRDNLKKSGFTQKELGKRAGIARGTVTSVLNGVDDYKVTTLIAVLDRLGHEMVFVPKAAVRGLEGLTTPTELTVKTGVQIAIDKYNERLKEM
jgi:transcriptional regulator with XRE-family HTH domain